MAKSNNKYTLTPNIEDKDIYKTVLDTRNFEISLFWQRSNYFLILNSGIAIGFFNLSRMPKLGSALFGFIVSLLWFRVNLGSKFWQSRWEHRLSEIEKQIAPNIDLFSAQWDTMKSDVKRSFENNTYTTKGCFTRWLDKQVLKKPSVSRAMMVLPLTFMVFWVLAAGVSFLTPAKPRTDQTHSAEQMQARPPK